MITAKEIMTEIDEALKQFGSYSYHDKGASEVMDIPAIVNKLELMTSEDIVKVLTEVKENHKDPDNALMDIAVKLGNHWSGVEAEKFFETELFQELYE